MNINIKYYFYNHTKINSMKHMCINEIYIKLEHTSLIIIKLKNSSMLER